jgi:hypothetical protein
MGRTLGSKDRVPRKRRSDAGQPRKARGESHPQFQAPGDIPGDRTIKMTSYHWKCGECDWRGQDADLLRAPNPFDTTAEIVGCPRCKEVQCFINMCDEPGYREEASSGWPSDDGYRRTCHKHSKP